MQLGHFLSMFYLVVHFIRLRALFYSIALIPFIQNWLSLDPRTSDVTKENDQTQKVILSPSNNFVQLQELPD